MKDMLLFSAVWEDIFLDGGTNDQASPHRQVWPCTNSVVLTMVTPTARSFDIRVFRFDFLPTIEVYHLPQGGTITALEQIIDRMIFSSKKRSKNQLNF